jgi:surface polysaccharide O-acyltransferase-like enzyme
MVILLHSSAPFVLKNFRTLNVEFWAGNIFNSFSRIGVPLFVMLSGRFLLDGRITSVKSFYGKRFGRILLPAIFWSVFYMAYSAVKTAARGDHDFLPIIRGFISGQPYFHLWFIFMLAGLYLITPLLLIVKEKVGEGNMMKVGIGLLLMGIIIDLWSQSLSINVTGIWILWSVNYSGYFVLGYSLKTLRIKTNKAYLFGSYFVCSSLTVFLAYYIIKYGSGNPFFISYLSRARTIYAYSYLSPLTIVSAISIYLLFLNTVMKENAISGISQYTFGIYLVHAVLLEGLRALFSGSFTGYLSIAYIPLSALICFILSLFVVHWMRKVAWLKRLT